MPIRQVAVRLSQDLDLELMNGFEAPGPLVGIKVNLGRIQAQHLADALLEFSGNISKSAHRGSASFHTSGEDCSDRPIERRTEPVKILRGAVLIPRHLRRTGKKG